MEELLDETMMDISVNTTRKILNSFLEKGWLERRRNPKYKWDKTYQYRVNLIKIEGDLNKIGYHIQGSKLTLRSVKIDTSKYQNGDSDISNLNDRTIKIDRAIPETTTENTKETTPGSATYSGKLSSSTSKYLSQPEKSNETNFSTPEGSTGGRPAKFDKSTEDSPVHPYMVGSWKIPAKDNTDIILRMLVKISESNGVRLSDTDIDGLIDNTFRQWERLKEFLYHIQQDKHLNESQKQILFEHLYNGIKNQKLDDGYKRKIKHHLMRYFNITLESDEYDLGSCKPVPDSTSNFDLPKLNQEVPEMVESFDDYFN